MKRTYLKPAIKMAVMEWEGEICVSEYVRSDYGIDYGGIDTGGQKDPSANKTYTVWGEEEEQ